MKTNKFYYNIVLIICFLIYTSIKISAGITSNRILLPNLAIGRGTAILNNVALIRIKPGVENYKIASEFLLNNRIVVDYPLLKPEQSVTYNRAMMIRKNIHKDEGLSNVISAEEPLLRSFVIEYNSDMMPEDFCKWILKKCKSIEIAEPYYLPEILGIPNDPLATAQQTLQQIKAFQAWDYYQGDTNIVIGISDNGVFQEHEDLRNSIAPNWNEIPNDKIDNDGNGYVDDYIGYNFTWKDDNTDPGNTFHYTIDHGTNVAGVCGATYNNAKGMTGTAAKCRIFPMKAMAINDALYLKYSYETIIYAGIRQFSVLNCSWGSTGKAFSDFEQSIINYAIARDVAIVAAGGNFTSRSPSTVHPYYPADYFGVLGVGEVDVNDYVTTSSHLGAHVDIMAPGIGNYYTTNTNSYNSGGFSGTSAASPIVAGFVGLVRGYYQELNCLQALEFARQCIDDITDKNQQYRDIIPGRINMLKAFQRNPDSIPGIRPISHSYYYSDGQPAERLTLGDTFYLKIIAHNYLASAKNLRFVLAPAYDFLNTIDILDSSIVINKIESNADFTIEPFTFIVREYNTDLMFLRIDIYSDNNYHDFFLLPFTTGGEMTLFENDAIKFTVSDRGAIGFGGTKHNPQGIGYVYKGLDNQLYKAGLIAKTDSTKVVSALFGTGPDNNDFKPVKRFVGKERNIGIIDDSRASLNDKIGLEIKQTHIVPIGSHTVTKLLVEVKNISGNTLNDVAVGYFFDWDLSDDEENNLVFLRNEAIPDRLRGPAAAAEVAAYPDSTGLYFPVFGAAIYSKESGAIAQAAGLNYNITGAFSKEDQIKSLMSGTTWQNNGIDDISYVIGMRYPGILKPDEIRKCEICFGTGENLDNLTYRLSRCLELDSNFTSVDNKENIINELLEINPNPVTDIMNITTYLQSPTDVEIIIYDIFGSKLATHKFKAIPGTNKFQIKQNWSDGVHLFMLKDGKNILKKSFVVIK